ncbi:hypothetical protein RsS93_62180 [Rhizobium dioscoreae]|uniref:Uncharacterized protein n=1 Tax=Rhizobium dioscoreae TaxID=2653122 RepID=A0ABQ0ZEE1_9HYPH|nr:hypothetical protein RsS93_62180 [Rhizobium dioscoreae]
MKPLQKSPNGVSYEQEISKFDEPRGCILEVPDCGGTIDASGFGIVRSVVKPSEKGDNHNQWQWCYTVGEGGNQGREEIARILEGHVRQPAI